MYNIKIDKISDKDRYDYSELIKIFLPPRTFRLLSENDTLPEDYEESININFNCSVLEEKDAIKREIYNELAQLTGMRPAWGILTGVRPVKLAGELLSRLEDVEKVRDKLTDYYLLSSEKAELLLETLKYQQKTAGKVPENSISLYIGIPFCPTRCLYCSFTSNQTGPEEIEKYLKALSEEIRVCGEALKKSETSIESVYIGGGTPTTLTAEQLKELISLVKENFDLSKTREFTVEAGRPDTVTPEKLQALKNCGINRISINPQTMKDETLKTIGRNHSVEQTKNAFYAARETGDFIINADLIAGLPEETPEDFKRTVDEILDLQPENITVHTLAVKKASRLIEADDEFHYKQGDIVEKMLKTARKNLKEAGYRPYYLYRQKHMAGAFENVGYCREDTPCIYNIRIMEEKQSILALGAGGISKKFYPSENRLERIPNVSNYQIYIERLLEMTERKRKNFF